MGDSYSKGQNDHVPICTHTCMHVRIYVCVQMLPYPGIYISVCLYMYICSHTCSYIHAYTYIDACMYILTYYTYMHKLIVGSR